jgi:quercetin dioxygenase-like cupin family protein
MKDNKAFQQQQEILWEDLGKGVKRQVFGYDDHLMVVKVKFEKGAIGTLHSHLHSQASYVADGVFDVTIGEEKKILKAGDGFYVQPHVIHGVTCLEAGMLVDSFSPYREDFVKKENV